MSGIVWLASYPKSGNTWFRLWLANLDRDDAADINGQPGTAGLASARAPFDRRTLIASGDLTDDECERLRPAVYRMIGREIAGLPPLRRIWKTHDAWTMTIAGEALLGGAAAAARAILVVRDPRDVVASLAHHERCGLDEAIAFMGQDDGAFSASNTSQANQMRQRLGNWSSFQQGWLDQVALPCHVVRYEDMHVSPRETLAAALAFVGIDASPEVVETAVRLSAFDVTRAQERSGGFVEAPGGLAGGFFRRGVSAGWRDELSSSQAARVVAAHRSTMHRLGYDDAGL